MHAVGVKVSGVGVIPTLRDTRGLVPTCKRNQHVYTKQTPGTGRVRPIPLQRLHAVAGGERPVSPEGAVPVETPQGSACPFPHLSRRPEASRTRSPSPGGPSTWRVLEQGEAQGLGLPSPPGRFCWVPVIGDVLELDRTGAGRFFLDRYREFGPSFTWQLGGDKLVDIVDYETIKSLLQQDSKVMVSWNPESFYALLGENSRRNMTNGERRMAQRKFLAPGFTERAVVGYLGKLESICREQLDAWCEAGTMDLATQAKALSFEFSTRLLVDFEVPAEQKQQIRGWFDDVFRAMIEPGLNIPGTKLWKGLQAKAKLSQVILELVKASREAGESSSSEEPTGKSVFDYMLAARLTMGQQENESYQISDRDVTESGIGLIIAGNDTSGLGVQGLLGCVAALPDVVERLRREQEEVVAQHGPSLTRAALECMPYADAVVKEVLRLLPPASGVFRRTLVDLEVHGYYLPAGSLLHLNFLTAQLITDPRLTSSGLLTSQDLSSWAPALPPLNMGATALRATFNPDRWLSATAAPLGSSSSSTAAAAAGCPLHEGGARGPAAAEAAASSPIPFDAKPSALLTFGAGPHVCLGAGLFNLEAKVLLALLARDYQVAVAAPEEAGSPNFSYGFIPELKQPTWLQFQHRA